MARRRQVVRAYLGWVGCLAWTAERPHVMPLRPFSMIAAVAILVTGTVGAVFVSSSASGLLERLTQLRVLSWFTAAGVLRLRRAQREG